VPTKLEEVLATLLGIGKKKIKIKGYFLYMMGFPGEASEVARVGLERDGSPCDLISPQRSGNSIDH
jgi:hypothetical protein